MVANLNSNSSVIHELSEVPRRQNSFDIMTNITEYIATKPPVEWVAVLLESDFPRDYMITFASIVSIVTAMLVPFWACNMFISFLAESLLPDDSKDFIVNKFLPELGDSVKGIKV